MKKTLLLLVACAFMASGPLNAAPKEHKQKHHHGKGLKRDPQKFHEFLQNVKKRPKKSEKSDVLYPASFDLSKIGSLPRNQGGCGDCWAYALTKALASEYMIAGISVPGLLDVEYLTANCGGPVREYGCGGGDFPAGQNFLNGLGPWGNGVDPANGNGCKQLKAVATATDFIMLDNNGSSPTDEQMVEVLNEKHVLVIDLAADNSWSNYPSGSTMIAGVQVFNRTTSTSIDHMINRVGYICTTTSPDGKSCGFDTNGMSKGIIYLDMNNWGEDWGVNAPNGHGGYIYETRLANVSGEDVAYFKIAEPTPPPTPPTPPGPIPPTPPVNSGLPWLVWVFLGLLGVGIVVVIVKSKSSSAKKA